MAEATTVGQLFGPWALGTHTPASEYTDSGSWLVVSHLVPLQYTVYDLGQVISGF